MKRISAIAFCALLFLSGLAVGPYVHSQQKTQNLVRYTKTGIDMKVATTTTIITTENSGERFVPLMVNIVPTAASALTIGGTVSVGTNSATFNNIMAASTTPTSLNNLLPNTVSALTDSVAPNTAIVLNLSLAATGTSGTMSATIIGYYY